FILCCLSFTPTSAQEKPVDKPAFDQIVLNNGSRMEGLVVEEASQQIRFQFLVSRPGVRTLVFEVNYDRSEVASISKAREPGRSLAKEKIHSIETSKNREATKIQ